jgi:hypothetical protein
MSPPTRSVVLAATVLLAAPPDLSPQTIPRSQRGTVSQQIAGTRISVEYDRPVARGRELFGSLVPWGRIWSPSANTAAVIAVSTDIRVNGQPLPAGTYSLWAEPRPDVWTIVFSRVHPAFHLKYPSGQDALRVETTPREGTHLETLAFYFPLADERRGELVLHWGTVIVPLRLDVP